MQPYVFGIAVLVFLSGGTIPANADDRTGFALNAGIGTSIIRDEDGTETFRGTAFAYHFGAEYRFTERFALGFNVFDLGTASDVVENVDTEIEVRGFDFVARVYFPVSETAEFFGTVGSAVYNADVEPGGSTGLGLFGDEAWLLGVGADFGTREDFSIRVEGQFLNGRRDESGGLLVVGISYRF